MPLPRTRLEVEGHLPDKAFQDLDPAWKNDMGSVRPLPGQGFTEEQRSLLKGFYLIVPETKLQQLKDAQQGSSIRLEPVNLNGVWLLPADCQTDLRPGDTYGKLAGLLTSLKYVLAPDSAWPKPTI